MIDCFVDSVGGSAFVECDDRTAEAEIRAQAFTPGEALAAECEPITWDTSQAPGRSKRPLRRNRK
ncbi:hypothetical protein DQ384_37045 [Sphaerisporangium album]|uniref:Uncharacterized protein n=1 Tax=Sphaerisporangium album TaxID=509200 RepID=A0A367EV11_9ACTN|nr:hypothetical protein DQ384_37045 [Sphaerisporangium album]